MWVCISTLLGLLALTSAHQAQRVPPGVPPQQYQQQQPHQHQVPINQQVPQFQQQHVPQMQQVPLQQQQQQQQQLHQQQQQHPQQGHPQQVHPHQGHPQQVPHGHQQQPHQVPQMSHQGMPHQGGHQPLLNVADMMHEKEHIQEHMEVPMDTSKMSEQELQFHYFKMHDADNNNKLDGCELIKSLIHWHEEPEQHKGIPIEEDDSSKTDEDFALAVDPILKQHDFNNDGFIDYAEFVKAEDASVPVNYV